MIQELGASKEFGVGEKNLGVKSNDRTVWESMVLPRVQVNSTTSGSPEEETENSHKKPKSAEPRLVILVVVAAKEMQNDADAADRAKFVEKKQKKITTCLQLVIALLGRGLVLFNIARCACFVQTPTVFSSNMDNKAEHETTVLCVEEKDGKKASLQMR